MAWDPDVADPADLAYLRDLLLSDEPRQALALLRPQELRRLRDAWDRTASVCFQVGALAMEVSSLVLPKGYGDVQRTRLAIMATALADPAAQTLGEASGFESVPVSRVLRLIGLMRDAYEKMAPDLWFASTPWFPESNLAISDIAPEYGSVPKDHGSVIQGEALMVLNSVTSQDPAWCDWWASRQRHLTNERAVVTVAFGGNEPGLVVRRRHGELEAFVNRPPATVPAGSKAATAQILEDVKLAVQALAHRLETRSPTVILPSVERVLASVQARQADQADH